MNKLVAIVSNIDSLDDLNLVDFSFFGHKLTMMSLELSDKIKLNSKVILGVKSSDIAIAKDFKGELSFSNFIKAKIKNLDIGKLLASVTFDIENEVLTSIVTSKKAKQMNLKISDEVQIIIKASDLYIHEIL